MLHAKSYAKFLLASSHGGESGRVTKRMFLLDFLLDIICNKCYGFILFFKVNTSTILCICSKKGEKMNKKMIRIVFTVVSVAVGFSGLMMIGMMGATGFLLFASSGLSLLGVWCILLSQDANTKEIVDALNNE